MSDVSLSGDQVHCFCVGIFHEPESFVLQVHEISLHKNNSPTSPDKDTPLTDSCYKVLSIDQNDETILGYLH